MVFGTLLPPPGLAYLSHCLVEGPPANTTNAVILAVVDQTLQRLWLDPHSCSPDPLCSQLLKAVTATWQPLEGDNHWDLKDQLHGPLTTGVATT